MTENSQVTDPPDQPLLSTSGGSPSPASPHGRPADITTRQLLVARTWLDRGIPVIPCSRTDKGPLVKGFGRAESAHALTKFTDRSTVESWWTGRYRRAHVGILTGRGNHPLIVIDLDIRKERATIAGRWAQAQGGTDVLEGLAADAGEPWPDTYTVLTPSGGMHLYYQAPTGDPIGCATGDGPGGPHLGPLVDVRGEGGLVIAAGSFSTAQGRPYTWQTDSPRRPQPVPTWLLELLRRPAPRPAASPAAPLPVYDHANRAEKYAAAAIRGEVDAVASAREGERNRRLFAAARRLAELRATAPTVLVESEVEQMLLGAALQAGLDQRAAARTIRSGWAHGTTTRAVGAA